MGAGGIGKSVATVMRESGLQVLEDCDCLVPVPLHPWRRCTRRPRIDGCGS